MSKTAKQALVTELTTALAVVSPSLSLPLPRGIAQAVDHLADSILRWQARQGRLPQPGARTMASTSDALVLLMDRTLEEEVEPSFHEVEEAEEAPLPAPVEPPPPSSPELKKTRPRLLKPRSPHK